MVMFVLRKPLNAQTHPKRRKIIFKPNKHGTAYYSDPNGEYERNFWNTIYVKPTDHEQCKIGY